MRVGTGDNTYEWVDHWAKVPDTESARQGWAHHGMVITEADEIIGFHQGDSTFLVFDKDGNLRRTWDVDLTEAHGITLVKEGETEYLWVADCADKPAKDNGYEFRSGVFSGRVVKMTLDGQIVMELQRPDLAIYRDGTFSPTWVAVNEERYGGNGDIWVTDGYGQNHIHRYNKSGEYISSINGTESAAGAFDCPHSIFIDRRKSEPEMYVADRTNHRLVAYDLDGVFKRAFASDILTSPGGFVTYGDLIVVIELNAKLAVLDGDDKLVCRLADNDSVVDAESWPNVSAGLVKPGKFNSPHGLTVDGDGNLYVAEWLIGGRFTKLAKVS